jgi:hypothetical protein
MVFKGMLDFFGGSRNKISVGSLIVKNAIPQPPSLRPRENIGGKNK